MADGTATGIDPRYDPQFQRGYVGHSASQGKEPTRRAPAPSRMEPPRSARGAPTVSTATIDDRPSMSPSSSQPVAAMAPVGDADAGPVRGPAIESLFDEPGPVAPASADPWFLGAWTIAVLAVALGAALFLAGIMADYGMSMPSYNDRWLQTVAWTVAPSLVQGGMVGVVGMLVWTGLRHAQREWHDMSGEANDSPAPR